jgi:hypothetical protein
MVTVTRTHGGVGAEGVINGTSGVQIGGSVKFYKIQVQNSAYNAIDLRPEMAANPDGGTLGVLDYVARVFPSGIISYFVENNANGNINLIVDGHAAPAAANIQADIRNLGTTVPSLFFAGTGNTDVTGSNVTLGTGFSVNPSAY